MVPLAPGTGGDVVARLSLNAVAQTLGQSIVIENKGGAGGTIGAGQVAKAEPDGYTLLFHSSTHVIAASLYTNLPYDTANDFAAVAPVGSVPSALVVSPSKGFRDLKDFVEKAKANPAGFTYASAGVGATTHLTAERFRLSAGFNAVHVPFRGGGFQPEIMAGRVDFGYLADRDLAAEHQGRPPAGARGVEPEARHGAAGSADHAGDGLRQFRLRDLVRHVPAGQDAACDRR